MKNYSEMRDQEINMAVAEILFPDRDVIESKSRPPCACVIGQFPNKWVDYCNNPADAWPIIADSEIDILQNNGQDCSLATNSAVMMMRDDDVFICQDANPLRAAMIVFLMMQESKP